MLGLLVRNGHPDSPILRAGCWTYISAITGCVVTIVSYDTRIGLDRGYSALSVVSVRLGERTTHDE